MATTDTLGLGCSCGQSHAQDGAVPASSRGSIYDHVLKYTGVFGGVQVLKMLASVARNKLTAMFLGGRGVGLISVYNSITEVVVTSSNLGVPLNATRRSSELLEEGDHERLRYFIMVVRTWVLLTAILSVVICSMLSPLVSYILFDCEYSHWPQVVTMIPVVVCFLLAEGECAVLKGLRRVRQVAVVELTIAVTTLLLTVPFYYLMGIHGVVVGLICSGLASLLAHFWFSLRIAPYRVRLFDLQVLREGWPMVVKGIPYVLAGVSTAALGMVILAIIQMAGTLDDVGYYRTGYALMVGYAGTAYMALEADYYPRLSSVNGDPVRFNRTINQQIEVCVLIVTPFLIPFIVMLPWIIPLLFDSEFLVATQMTVMAAFYTFLRGIMLPVFLFFIGQGRLCGFLGHGGREQPCGRSSLLVALWSVGAYGCWCGTFIERAFRCVMCLVGIWPSLRMPGACLHLEALCCSGRVSVCGRVLLYAALRMAAVWHGSMPVCSFLGLQHTPPLSQVGLLPAHSSTSA